MQLAFNNYHLEFDYHVLYLTTDQMSERQDTESLRALIKYHEAEVDIAEDRLDSGLGYLQDSERESLLASIELHEAETQSLIAKLSNPMGYRRLYFTGVVTP